MSPTSPPDPGDLIADVEPEVDPGLVPGDVLYRIAEAASSATDLTDFYGQIHRVISG